MTISVLNLLTGIKSDKVPEQITEIMLNNPVGTSLSQATAIPSNTTFKNRATRSKPNLFSFNLTNPGVLSLNFKSLGRSASLTLIQDRNQNSVVEADEVIQTVSSRSKKAGKLSLADLPTGTYYIQVAARGNSPYRLKLSAGAETIGTGGTSGGTGGTGGGTPKGNQSFVQQVVDLTNNFRAKNGLAPLTLNSKLTEAAQIHTENMAVQDFFSHTGKDGSSAGDRAAKMGYDWRTLAENIAAGQRSPAEVVQAWINSPGHRENMLNPSVKEIGVGYFFLANDTGTTNYNAYWTQNFGRS
jgi:uncharacterized protein YkwD